MSGPGDQVASDVTIRIPADLWRDALSNARAMGLRPGRRTAEDVIAAYLLFLLTRATSDRRNQEAAADA